MNDIFQFMLLKFVLEDGTGADRVISTDMKKFSEDAEKIMMERLLKNMT